MKTTLALFTVAALASSSAAFADKGDKGNGQSDKANSQYQAHGTVSRAIDTGCPPGLAKKQNGCQPPGQARKNFARGTYLPREYSNYTAYRDIPESYRSRIVFVDRYRYIYQEDRVYIIDPTTRLIRDVIQLLQ